MTEPEASEFTRRVSDLRHEIAKSNELLNHRIDRVADGERMASDRVTRVETIVNEMKDDIKRIEENQKADRADLQTNRRVAVSTAFVAVAILVTIIFGILQLVLT